MIRENAYTGQKVRVIGAPTEMGWLRHAGRAGVIIQIWPSSEYKWYEWATIELEDGTDSDGHILFADIEPADLFPVDPHPGAFQEKLARLGWGAWQPTPGVTDEGAVLYITLGEKSTYIMTTDEALALSDAELQQHILSAIGMSYEDACKIPRVPSGGEA